MIRLRCGVIFTDAFLAWLRDWVVREGSSHEGRVMALEYVRCKEGLRQGQAWLEWMWVKRAGLSEHCVFHLSLPASSTAEEAAQKPVENEIDLYLSPQTQQGLRWRHLDAKNGQPVAG